MKLSLGVLFLALAACSGSSSGDAASPTSQAPGGGGGGGGGPGDGTKTAPDPDADDGPLWDGKLPGTPRLLASGVLHSSLVDDAHLLYTTSAGAFVVDLTDGTSITIATGKASDEIITTGKVGLVFGTVDGKPRITAWSQAAGLKVLPFAADRTDVRTWSNGIGSRSLIVQSGNESGTWKQPFLAGWMIDASTLATTPITLPHAGSMGACTPNGEAFVCSSTPSVTIAGSPMNTDLWTLDATGVHLRSVLTDSIFIMPPKLIDGALILKGDKNTYRMVVESPNPVVTLVDGAAHIGVFQNGWMAVEQNNFVRVMHTDGTGSKQIDAGAIIAPALADYYYSGVDSTRIKWIPICDAPPPNSKAEPTNLRLYDPQTEKTVSVSKGCHLLTITYSDNFAVTEEDWISTPNAPVFSGSGTPTVFDLRDGTHREAPAAEANDLSATPTGKSRLMFGSLQYDDHYSAEFWDAHGSATSSAIPIAKSLKGIEYLESGAGIVYAAWHYSTTFDPPTADVFFMSL